MRILVLISALFTSMITIAADLAPKKVAIAEKVVSVKFDLSHLGEDCGLNIKWGDGSESKIRVGRDVNEADFEVIHVYKSHGAFIFEAKGEKILRGLGSVLGCRGDAFQQIVQIESGSVQDESLSLTESSPKPTMASEPIAKTPLIDEEKAIQPTSIIEGAGDDKTLDSLPSHLAKVDLPERMGNLIAQESRDKWVYEAFCEKKLLGGNVGHYVFSYQGVPVQYEEAKLKGGCANGLLVPNWVLTEIDNKPYKFPTSTATPDQIGRICGITLKHTTFDPLREKLQISDHRIFRNIPVALKLDNSYAEDSDISAILYLSELFSLCHKTHINSLILNQKTNDPAVKVIFAKVGSVLHEGTQKILLALVKREITYGGANEALSELASATENNVRDVALQQLDLEKKLAIARANSAQSQVYLGANQGSVSAPPLYSNGVSDWTKSLRDSRDRMRATDLEREINSRESNRRSNCSGRGGVYINGVCN